MQTHVHLIKKINALRAMNITGTLHASLASVPERTDILKEAVLSLIPQIDILHVFLQDFDNIPDFLDHEKIFVTRSQDFSKLGECGKYYWTGEFSAFHFMVSDSYVYPQNYIERMKGKILEYQKKAVICCGGYKLTEHYESLSSSGKFLTASAVSENDIELEIPDDACLAFHSDTISVSWHHFYQPLLSSVWFAILAKQQNVPIICISHPEDWIRTSVVKHKNNLEAAGYFTDFLIDAWFNKHEHHFDCSHINSCFDRIYVMNLDRRNDRWKKLVKRTQKHGINVNRFPAVDGYREPVKSQWDKYFNSGIITIPDGVEPITTFKDKYLNYRHYFTRIHFMETKLGRKAIQSPGAWGYALSYISILTEAIRQKYDRIMILDDDVLLHKDFNQEFARRMNLLPNDWLLIMLGAMQHNWNTPFIDWENDLFYHCHGSSIASHAVGIDKKVFLPILFYSKKLDLPIDEGAIYHIQNVYDKRSYVFYPNLAIQDIVDSDISSSVIASDDVERKSAIFRWDFKHYEF
jgi:GR25 family glycosyltransferase involved in LPS biosynthesis